MEPALVRFYGGSAQEWQAVPWGKARQYLSSIPRLMALEAEASPMIKIPDMPQFDLNKVLSETRAAVEAAGRAGQPAAERKPLSAMGIGVSS